jgi:hypothetical protein
MMLALVLQLLAQCTRSQLRTEIGEISNFSRKHVNRVLGQFARDGWITKTYSQLQMWNTPAFIGFACGTV